MKVAVDTHALVWFLAGSSLLSAEARRALREAQESEGIIASTAVLADLWYVAQTTQAFSTGDLDSVRDVVADDSTTIALAPIDLDVFDHWRRPTGAFWRIPGIASSWRQRSAGEFPW